MWVLRFCGYKIVLFLSSCVAVDVKIKTPVCVFTGVWVGVFFVCGGRCVLCWVGVCVAVGWDMSVFFAAFGVGGRIFFYEHFQGGKFFVVVGDEFRFAFGDDA